MMLQAVIRSSLVLSLCACSTSGSFIVAKSNENRCSDCTIKDHLPCRVKLNPTSDCDPPIVETNYYPNTVKDLSVNAYRDENGSGAINVSWRTPNDVSTKYIQGFQISVVEIGDGNGIQFCYHFDMKNATWKDGVDYNLKFDFSGCIRGLPDGGEVTLYVLPLRKGKPDPPRVYFKLPQHKDLAGNWQTIITTQPYPNNGSLYVQFDPAPDKFGFTKYWLTLEDKLRGEEIKKVTIQKGHEFYMFTNMSAGIYTILVEPQDLPPDQLERTPLKCLCKTKSKQEDTCESGCLVTGHTFEYPSYVPSVTVSTLGSIITRTSSNLGILSIGGDRPFLVIGLTLTTLLMIIIATVSIFCYKKRKCSKQLGCNPVLLDEYDDVPTERYIKRYDRPPQKVFIISDIDEIRQNLLTKQFCKFLQQYYPHQIMNNLCCNQGNLVNKEQIQNEIMTASRLVLINSKHAFLKYKKMMTSPSVIEHDLFTYSVQCLRENMTSRPEAFEDVGLVQFSCTPDEYLIREFQIPGVSNFKLMDDIVSFLQFLHNEDENYHPPMGLSGHEYMNTLLGSQLQSAIYHSGIGDSGFNDDTTSLKEIVLDNLSDNISDINSMNISEMLLDLNRN